ncbi:hypothetical protein M440DRAFT_1066426 [Trichoderma longibrachiatum ATCC 18648]|uniref:Uncharacterized protein n=1 Tax=Trichoderma longibrachiatum ATCC 18648 TaxID=983965 RepID=A0A2T4BWA8_TRILO|nr:hypothetical protein M440DRAFT_1066426 [Trichoderma longibrachiatum ATCC 18648]
MPTLYTLCTYAQKESERATERESVPAYMQTGPTDRLRTHALRLPSIHPSNAQQGLLPKDTHRGCAHQPRRAKRPGRSLRHKQQLSGYLAGCLERQTSAGIRAKV